MDKPLPVPNAETAPFWDAAAAGQLVVQRCGRCSHAQLYPRLYCVRCHAQDLAWDDATGAATVHSFTIVRRAPSAAFNDDVPYVVALVDLDEGPRLMTNIIGCGPEDVRIGMPVEVSFDHVGDDIALPKFVPKGDV